MEMLKRLYYRRLKKKNSMKDFAPSVKKSKRSFWGNVILGLFLLVMAVAFFFPVLYMVSQSLKPMNEMFIFPPKILVQNPTLDNYRDFVNVLANTMVPVTRSLFNSLFVVVIGSIGHILLASLCAYPLAKYKFPGSKFFNQIIVYSLMFNASVTAIPNFLTIAGMGMLDTQWAIIVPGLASTLGLYLMKNFMEQIPDSLMEAAQIDGAGYARIHFTIVMPVVKPALVTAFIMVFQSFWTNTGANFIYTEAQKGFAYVVGQLASGKVAGVGASFVGISSASSVIMFAVPLVVFLIMQNNVVSTMATSGMKE
ncbi:MAG: carbohydrate ABC transporter permease [Lachnospiraceae bacterium]|jgi:putative chitobiose transport system permease protein|nr:carbohydrate ABC transporter permease [Lachnospiraceae bacterium]